MPYKEQTLLRSKVEIHIPYPDADDALANNSSAVMRTARKFRMWFGDTEISKSVALDYDQCGGDEIEIVFIILSFCTTERLNTYILTAVSFARGLAREIGREKIFMVINGVKVPIKAA